MGGIQLICSAFEDLMNFVVNKVFTRDRERVRERGEGVGGR